MARRKPQPAAAPRPLFLSPAGLRHVRTKVGTVERERLAGLVTSGAIRIITTKEHL